MTAPASNFIHGSAGQERDAIRRIIARPRPPFPEWPAVQIERAVYRAHTTFHDSPIRDLIPSLVERLARDDLRHRLNLSALVGSGTPAPTPTAGRQADQEAGAP